MKRHKDATSGCRRRQGLRDPNCQFTTPANKQVTLSQTETKRNGLKTTHGVHLHVDGCWICIRWSWMS